jgi:hypothetical protein
MNLKAASLQRTRQNRKEKTAETEFSSLQHLHGMEINLHKKSTPNSIHGIV